MSGKKNILLFIASVAISLLVLELIARKVLPEPRPWLYPQIRYQSDEDIGFTLVPSQKAFSRDKEVVINHDGHRDPERAKESDIATSRIIVLGDSVMFGHGVAQDEVAAALIEVALNENGIAAAVINTSVPSYNTVQQVDFLEREVSVLQPDIVILGYYWNDLSPKAGVHVSREGWLLSSDVHEDEISALERFWNTEFGFSIRNMVKSVRLVYGVRQGLRSIRNRFFNSGQYDVRTNLLNGTTTDAMELGWTRVAEAMGKLADLAGEHGFDVVLLALPIPQALGSSFPESDYMERVGKLADSNSFYMLDVTSAMEAEYKGHESLFIPYDADHPNELGHATIAAAVIAYMEESGLVKPGGRTIR